MDSSKFSKDSRQQPISVCLVSGDRKSNTSNCARDRVLSGFRGRGGFQLPVSLEDMAGESEGRESSVLTAWCMKLFLSLVVRQ